MNILCIGGCPSGLYFALLMKLRQPAARVTVVERNRPFDTFGWGVVLSDQTLANLRRADPKSAQLVGDAFNHRDDIEVFFKGRSVRSGGHGFCGIGRKRLLNILQDRCIELGVDLVFETDLTDDQALAAQYDADLVVASDGLNSRIRNRCAGVFEPDVDLPECRFVWLGTHKTFDVFIVETPEAVWKAHGLDTLPQEEAIAFCEKLFAPYLDGTKLALEDAIDLADEFSKGGDIDTVLEGYEAWLAGSRPGGKAIPPMLLPLTVRGIELKSRIIASPMATYSAVDGVPQDLHLVHLGARALGGAALVFVEMTSPNPEGRIRPGCTGLYSKTQQSAFKRIVAFVHAQSSAKIGMQLGHSGPKGSTQLDRYPLEVFSAVRDVWPGHLPMSVRISAHDWAPGGNTADDAIAVATLFKRAGCDFIDVSSGQTTRVARPVYGRMYQTPFCDRIRNEVGIKTIAVGAITDADQANSIIAAGRAGLCAAARPHLADPAWTLHEAARLQSRAVGCPRQYLSRRDQMYRELARQQPVQPAVAAPPPAATNELE